MPEEKTARQIADEIIEAAAEVISPAVEVQKLHISFWDKLVLLNAGTLTLSFTAAASFHGHTYGDGGVGYLFAAWKLLILSIIFALTAQWLSALSVAHVAISVNSKLLSYRVQRFSSQLAKELGQETKDEESVQYDIKSEKHGRYERRTRMFSAVFGLCAHICTVMAFIWLYRFGHTNMSFLLGR